MKKQLIAFLLTLALLLTVTGCSVANASQKLDAVEDRVDAKMEIAEDKLEVALQKAVDIVPPATEAAPAPAKAEPASVENPQALTEEQASQIALDYVGYAADQITRLHTEYEIDDGMPQYDIEFHQGDWEYEFEIHAEDGRIISYDKDHKFD